MAQRQITLPDIGEVILSKRRGSKNIRLSINAKGQVRVGVPYWLPYGAGLTFLYSKKLWLQKQLTAYAPSTLHNGSRVGKLHTLVIHRSEPKNRLADTRVTPTTIEIRSQLEPTDPQLQKLIVKACERALKLEAEHFLPSRLSTISAANELPFRGVRIRKLTSRWGSCSSKSDITLSIFLVQLPWELVDYVITHELVHTKFHDHSPRFWDLLEQKLPGTRELRHQIKLHRPRIEPLS